MRNQESKVPAVNEAAREEAVISEALSILTRRVQSGAAIRDLGDCKRYLALSVPYPDREVFRAVWLSHESRVLGVETLSVGTLSEAAVFPREVVKAALKAGAAAVVFSHNHPSGNPQESMADVRITERLRDALALVDVRVLDHLITAGGACTSLAEKGHI